MRRSLPILLVACLAPGPPTAPAQASSEPAAFETVVKPFLARNCYLCHNCGNSMGCS